MRKLTHLVMQMPDITGSLQSIQAICVAGPRNTGQIGILNLESSFGA